MTDRQIADMNAETNSTASASRRGDASTLFDDPNALAALRRRLLRQALRDLNAADAEDAAQETLLALHCARRDRAAGYLDLRACGGGRPQPSPSLRARSFR